MCYNETVRLLAEFAKHAEHGLNAIAQSIPRDAFPAGGDPDPEPKTVAIETDVDSDGVALNFNPKKVPAVILYAEGGADVDLTRGGERAKFADQVQITGAYLTADGVNAADAARDCGYFLRAAVLTFARLNNPADAVGYKTLNGIELEQIQRVTWQRFTTAEPNGVNRKMWGFFTVYVKLRETLA